MSSWEWIAPAASFAGAVLGASLSYLGAQLGTRQQDVQGRREEWGRRFTAALDAIGYPQPRRRQLGLLLLGKLARSSLASDEERRLADELLSEAARYQPGGTDLRLVHAGPELDALRLVQDNGATEPGKDDQEDGS